MRKSNIVLCGFMASGKTTVGRLIAESTGMRMLDTDELIVRRAGKSIPDIFESIGEEGFRELEREVVAQAAACERAVIAVGGGAVMDEDNVAALRANGLIYLLEVSPDEVLRRAPRAEGRPLLADDAESVLELMRSRKKRYLEVADMVVETTARSPRAVATQVEGHFNCICGKEAGEEVP